MSDGVEGSSSRKRPRQAPDLDRAPVGLWLVAILALAAAAGVGYWVFGRDEPTPPSQGAAITIGQASESLLTAADVGGGVAEQADDAPVTVLTLADVDPGSDCADPLEGVGLAAWDPLAGGTDDALAERTLVATGGGAVSHEIAHWPATDLDAVREAVAECPEVALAGDAGEGTATFAVRDAAEADADRVVVETTITAEGAAAGRTSVATVWLRDALASTVARTGGVAGGSPLVDDARADALVVVADDRLVAALERVS